MLTCSDLMIFSKEYVAYLGRQTVRQLIAQDIIRTQKPELVTERVNVALLDEMQVEDRINEEVRNILSDDTIRDEMHRTGAQYPEMFKRMKAKLVTRYKAVL